MSHTGQYNADKSVGNDLSYPSYAEVITDINHITVKLVERCNLVSISPIVVTNHNT